MPLTNIFKNFVCTLVTGGGGLLFNNANAHIGVGNGTTAFAATQTDLQVASTSRKGMDSTYPQVSNGVMTFRSTFGTADANFTWSEWGIFNAATGNTMMNRVVQANGTKASTETKQVTVTITLSV